jgi:hypothetical protein
LHIEATQTRLTAEQMLDAQSEGCMQVLPSPHAGQLPPPQSMSVSLPSLSWSSHVDVAHVSLNVSHADEAQSEATLQSCPTWQGEHVPPPQSTSVSLPSLMPSVHSDETHVEDEQVSPTGQSVEVRHCTQAPLPSHFVPAMGDVHAAPRGAGTVPGVPSAEQVPRRQALPGEGVFEVATALRVPPAPSQTVA